MKLCEIEFDEVCDLAREVEEIVDNYLANNEIFARIQGYIKLANDNLIKMEKLIKRHNPSYKKCTFEKIYFNKTALLESYHYKIELLYVDEYHFVESTSIDVGFLIRLLAQLGLIEEN